MLARKSAKQTASPCARCGSPSEFGVWTYRICGPCAGDWFAQADKLPAGADYEAFTEAWVQRRHEAAHA